MMIAQYCQSMAIITTNLCLINIQNNKVSTEILFHTYSIENTLGPEQQIIKNRTSFYALSRFLLS